MSIYDTIKESLRAGRKGVLATVISRTGSAPRDVGARMFVDENGQTDGTVGGGLLELQVQKAAIERKNDSRATIMHFQMNAKTVEEQGMLCGGNVDVLLEPVIAKHGEMYQRLADMERKGKKGIVVTSLADGFTKTLIDENLGITGDAMNESNAMHYLNLVTQGRPVIADDGAFLVEPVFNRSRLYIFGAGHVSQFIAKIASMVDFAVIVIDDRQEFANSVRFPEADEVIVEDFKQAFSSLSFSGNEFVVIVTRGHSHDAEVLREALAKDARYIGMIGSKRKVKMIFDLMRQSGFSDEAVSKVYAPIGLAIHAETPQEIAVSIVSQLIQIRAQ
ncbi:MAG: XshC-Cox1-family protein [Deltaproteobacteria bacterium]|nr:XshC-Cox1-family protein [Deltaproteobacteria bacterium]